MLKVHNIGLGFSLYVNQTPQVLADDLEKEVERLWLAEQKKRGKELFNGRILSATNIHPSAIDGTICEYRYWIAQRARPELYDVLTVRPVAVSGLIESASGIVFGQRARSTTQSAGEWELVPSGGIDTSHVTESGHVDFLSQMLIELKEELGLDSGYVLNLSPFCLVEDTDTHVLDICIAMQSPLSCMELFKIYDDVAKKEYDNLEVIPRTKINTFIKEIEGQMVQVSKTFVELFIN